jgi:hypothetical protein
LPKIKTKVATQKSIIESVVQENIGNSENSNEYSPVDEKSRKLKQLAWPNDKNLTEMALELHLLTPYQE